jgi:putative spermidine/putrescine transport system substrate-binding protein/spermidine/putrescine transport system substrate-binding protein
MGGAAALGAASLVGKPAIAQTKELRMFTWEGYADAAWVKEFETKHNCKVNAAYAGSVDEMFAKMSGSKGADFDIVAVDTSSIPRYLDAGLLAPVDVSKVPAAANLMADFQSIPILQKDGKSYGLPFAWGSLGMIYDTEFFAGREPTSWATMWDPALEGRLIALDDANNNIVTAALYLGLKNPYQLSDDEFKLVKEKLIEQKKLLLSYYAGFDDGVEIWKKNKIVAMFAMGEIQAKKMLDQGMKIKYIIPKENAVGWLDCLLLSSGTKENGLAHAWFDFVLDKKIGADMTAKFNYGNTTSAVTGMDYAKGLSWLQPPEDFNKRVNTWNEVKAAI